MLQTIYNRLSENRLEEAFELINANECEFTNNSTYWCMRGDLCCLIGEFNLAVSCYEKSISLDLLNSTSFHRLVEILKSLENTDSYNFYIKKQETIQNKLFMNSLETILNEFSISVNPNNLGLIKNTLDSFGKDWFFFKDDFFMSSSENIYKSYFLDTDNQYLKKSRIVLPLNESYIDNATKLTSYGINNFYTILIYKGKFYLVHIDRDTVKKFKNGDRNSTIVFHYLNEGDSNVFSLYKNIPNKFTGKYNRILLKGIEDFNLNNMAKIPLLASKSVSGHELFTQYPCPKLMHNIEVGHGSMPLKACGALDKLPNFAFSPKSYSYVDTLCATSSTDLLMWRAFTEISPEKVIISGNPKTDLLIDSNGRKNLERILKIKLNDKKIIFNMPTFHKHDGSGRVNGNESLNDFIKIPEFDYKSFDNFLGENNYICILKIHHAEQSLVSKTNKLHNFKNIYAISNLDLKKHNLDLYEVLNSGDLLITDYSSVYSDFLFMNKPIVFTNYDLDDYRENRGIALEPYDFWTAGPKVQTQECLENELFKSLSDNEYFLNKRKELKSVFFKYDDNNSSLRIWEHIDKISNK